MNLAHVVALGFMIQKWVVLFFGLNVESVSVNAMKLPRTLHLEDSRMPNGDAKDSVKLDTLTNKFLVIEEKVDGTGVSISFDDKANLSIQTRDKPAHMKQFDMLHKWANENMDTIWELINDRYIMFGEWMYAKHTQYYDNLCNYFLESDMYDTKEELWLSTLKRQELISAHASNLICSVPIIKIGRVSSREELKQLVKAPSFCKTNQWRQALKYYCETHGLEFDLVMRQTDDSDFPEGLYIKEELHDRVVGRYKYIRYEFLQAILKSGSHFADRQIIPNVVASYEEEDEELER